MIFEYTSFTRRAPTSEGKCADCYGDGLLWIDPEGHPEPCPLCKGSGLVPDEILAQREAEYRAWLKRRVAKKPRRKIGRGIMTVIEEVAYWRNAADEAHSKGLALVAWGISAGLRMAIERHELAEQRTVASLPHRK